MAIGAIGQSGVILQILAASASLRSHFCPPPAVAYVRRRLTGALPQLNARQWSGHAAQQAACISTPPVGSARRLRAGRKRVPPRIAALLHDSA
jgi:hypothetical protein